MQNFLYLDKINVIAILLMIIVFCVIMENLERFSKRQGSILYIYIGGMTALLHYCRFNFMHQISYKGFVSLAIFISLASVVAALFTEILCVFSNHVSKDGVVNSKKPLRKIIKKVIKVESSDEKFDQISKQLEKIEEKQMSTRFAGQESNFVKQTMQNMKNELYNDLSGASEVLHEEDYDEDFSDIAKEIETRILKSSIKTQDDNRRLEKIKQKA